MSNGGRQNEGQGDAPGRADRGDREIRESEKPDRKIEREAPRPDPPKDPKK